MRQYLDIPDRGKTGKGMVAVGALSPLMGALYLHPLDIAMEQLISRGNIYYVRYMDDMVIMAKTRWHLRNVRGDLKMPYSSRFEDVVFFLHLLPNKDFFKQIFFIFFPIH